jgi:hypothetical protein
VISPFQFCKSDGSSNGVRQFIDQDIVNFAKARWLSPCASLFALKVTLLVHSVVEPEL